jgi:hypothetical protein
MKYESPTTCHSKDMANVKVFADRQTDGPVGQKLYAPKLSIRGHKKGRKLICQTDEWTMGNQIKAYLSFQLS